MMWYIKIKTILIMTSSILHATKENCQYLQNFRMNIIISSFRDTFIFRSFIKNMENRWKVSDQI